MRILTALIVFLALKSGATDWFVRPLVYSGNNPAYPAAPIPVTGTYGSQNGTSYANAWNGTVSVVWGAGGVAPGDTLYVCDDHGYHITDNNFFYYQGITQIASKGIVIAGHPSHPGRIFGNATGLHTNGVGIRFTLADFPQSGATTNTSSITFSNLYFDNSVVLTLRTSSTSGGPSNIVFNACTFTNFDVSEQTACLALYKGFTGWQIVSNTLINGINGIYAFGNDGRIDNLYASNNIIGNMGNAIWAVGGYDCHGIGAQNLCNSILSHNTITNTGTAIEYFNGASLLMTNNLITYNYIRDIHVVTNNTLGEGIAVSGPSSDAAGAHAGFRIYGNIIDNTGIGATADYQGAAISSNSRDFTEMWNNTILHPKIGLRVEVAGNPVQLDFRNNILSGCYSNVYSIVGAGTSTFTVDYNLFYTNGTSTSFSITPSQTHDTHSVYGSPQFISANPSSPSGFQLSSGSPAIGSGANLTSVVPVDFGGRAWDNSDIGAWGGTNTSLVINGNLTINGNFISQ